MDFEISEREQPFIAVFEASSNAIIVTRFSDNLIRYSNEATSRVLGYPRENILGKQSPDFHVEPQAWAERLKDLKTKKKIQDVEIQLRRSDGSKVWVLVNATLLDIGGEAHLVSEIRDISKRKGLEKQLVESRLKFYNLLENSVQGVFIHRDWKILFCNELAAKIFGYDSVGDFLEVGTLEVLIAPEERDKLRKIRDARARGENPPPQHITRHIRKDGSLIWLETYNNLIQWEDGPAIQSAVIDVTDRIAAENELKLVGKQTEAILNNTPTGIIFIRDRQIVDVNAQSEELFGWTREELKGQSTEVLYCSLDDYNYFGEFLYPRLAKGEIINFDHEMKRKDGSNFWCRMAGQLIDKNDPAKGVIGTFDDITQLKIAERERDFQKFALDEHAIVSIADVRGDIIYVNEKFCETSGYTKDELIGQNHRLLKSGEHPPEFYKDLWRTIKQGEVWHGEIKNKKKNGDYYWVWATIVPFLDNQGKTFEYVAIRTDITERKDAERRAFESEERYRFFTENVDEGIVISRDNKVVDVSDIWAKMFRCTREEAIGRSPLDYTAPGMRIRVRELIDEGYSEPYESELLRHDGTTFPGLVRGRPVLFDGRLHRITTVRDITVLKESERKILAAKEEAERANEAKSEFLSSMSHELRTPLNSIIGFSQMLEINSKDQLSASQAKSVKYIKSAGHHLLELINEILDLAKIESGRFELAIESIGLLNLLEECHDLISTQAEERRLEISLVANVETASKVLADKVRLKQSLLNLLSNAVKYNREGGKISVVSHAVEGGFVRISVSDNGEGIPKERMGELFLPFHRISAEGTNVEGTGIGLTITKQLVELMGGKIGAESTQGEGSTFWIDVPVADESQGEDEHARIREEDIDLRGDHKTILYVEDNPANLDLMEMLLQEMEGLTLLSAHNAELGLSIVQRRLPDLVIMDINLPGLDGFQALRKINDLNKTKDIPVIALSANAMERDINRGLEAGFADYLTKPLDVERMLSTIKKILKL